MLYVVYADGNYDEDAKLIRSFSNKEEAEKYADQEIDYCSEIYNDFQLSSYCKIYTIVDKPDKKIYHIDKFIFRIPININNNPSSETRSKIIEEYKKLKQQC